MDNRKRQEKLSLLVILFYTALSLDRPAQTLMFASEVSCILIGVGTNA